MNKVENLLPVGTVVTVKDANKKLMIIGVMPKNGDTVYDYISVLYPEGFISKDQVYLFNRDDIEKVDFLGYVNVEYQVFRNNLIAAFAKE